MRLLALVLAGSVLGTGCATNSYEIRGSELQRLASMPPESRGQHVRLAEEVSETRTEPVQRVMPESQIIFFPEPNVWGPERRRWYGGGGGSWGGNVNTGNASLRTSGSSGGNNHVGGALDGLGKGGDGQAAAIIIVAAAVVILVAAAAVEGSRFDGFANMHPMQPVHVFGKDGGYTVMPLAWIDPQTAAWADHAIVKAAEGPMQELNRAPLDRRGFTYAVLGGIGTYKSVDGTVDNGTSTSIQLGYFPDQKIGVVGTLFFGWRPNAVNETLFESRYTLELQAYPVVAGPFHFGVYGGGGAANRWEDYPGMQGNEGTLALTGGGLVQLDINTRLALTARLGVTQAHGEIMNDALFGLSVY
jgi:hypothetical protein